ncbi:MAG: outer membrane beta-barrel domain-containing protein [Bdellovibrionales bacterium]
MKPLFVLLALVVGAYSFADEIDLPEEELARETTLPVFNKQRAVLNRNVITEKRFELGVGGGLELNEPYYNDIMFTAQATYNYSDVSAINVQGLMWMDGLSTYGEQLKKGERHRAFDATKAPHPTWGVLANYQFIAYYGKISITKTGVMNLNLFGLAGLGYINMEEANSVALNLGVGQNFFFTKSVGLRADMRMLIFQGPDATSQDLHPSLNPSASAFDDRIYYNTQLSLSLVYIL